MKYAQISRRSIQEHWRSRRYLSGIYISISQLWLRFPLWPVGPCVPASIIREKLVVQGPNAVLQRER